MKAVGISVPETCRPSASNAPEKPLPVHRGMSRVAMQFNCRFRTAVARGVARVTVWMVVLFPKWALLTGETLYRSAHLISSTTVPLKYQL
ncbi:hypothetical protein D3C87_2030520 [compost metagenome]